MTKIAVVAIAKDESNYLADWIHHYLYMDFEYIFVGINRTNDDSYEKLCSLNSNKINVENIDWIDQSKKYNESYKKDMQQIFYAYASNKIKEDTECTHILYVDIDEFLVTNDLSSINEIVSLYNNSDVISFNWFCQNGEKDTYSYPLNDVLLGEFNPHVKSLVSVASLDLIDSYRCHTPLFQSGLTHLGSNGSNFSPYSGQISNSAFIDNQVPIILHKMYRSEYEYLKLLIRGNPDDYNPIKLNRGGFITSGAHKYQINLNELKKYNHSLKEFYKSNGLSRSTIKEEEYDSLIAEFKALDLSFLENNLKRVLIIFRGTSLLSFYIDKLITSNISNANFILVRDLAISYEKTDLMFSYKLMLTLSQIRPEGPVVNKKVNEYREKLV